MHFALERAVLSPARNPSQAASCGLRVASIFCAPAPVLPSAGLFTMPMMAEAGPSRTDPKGRNFPYLYRLKGVICFHLGRQWHLFPSARSFKQRPRKVFCRCPVVRSHDPQRSDVSNGAAAPYAALAHDGTTSLCSSCCRWLLAAQHRFARCRCMAAQHRR